MLSSSALSTSSFAHSDGVVLAEASESAAKARDERTKEFGILASLDPVAIDRACVDLVYNCDDKNKGHLIERIESRNGTLTIDAAEKLGYGSKDYELIEV